MFLGLDSSTQSLSALVIDPSVGTVLADLTVNFGAAFPNYGSPSGFIPGGKDGEVHADPRMWLEALDLLLERLQEKIDLSGIRAIACSGQQHGSVYLDDSFPARLASLTTDQPLAGQISPALTRATAPIWMDTSTTAECAEIAAALGGDDQVCQLCGSVMTERFTGSQIRRFYKTQPLAYERTAVIHLVSSFLGSILAGKTIAIDHGDGAGMNLMNLATLDWDASLLEATAPDLHAKLPPLAPSSLIAGGISSYFVEKFGFPPGCQVVLSTGDNPSSLVGMGATEPGTVVVSLGTSDTFFAAMEQPVTDPQGYGHVFGNPAGGYMSLICFRNGSLAREALRDLYGLTWADFDHAGLSRTPAGNHGCRMLPFFGPEIAPRHDFTGPVRNFPADAPAPVQVRALLEGQFLNMRLHSGWIGQEIRLIRLTGGASQSHGIAQLIADVFQVPIERFAVANGAALGAALRAAQALGENLNELQATFCKPVVGSLLLPREDTAAIYQQALTEYAQLLQEQ